jgi:glutamate dehydrogenase (NADP+)
MMLPVKSLRRHLSSWQPGSSLARELSRKPAVKSLVGTNVHGNAATHIKQPSTLDRPLFRRGGIDSKFTSGLEVPPLIAREVERRDAYLPHFTRNVNDAAKSLVPLFDVYPKMAWAYKHLVEPERCIQFKVPWIDDGGNSRINRGFRVQHSSVLGPFSGGLTFSENANMNLGRAQSFEATFQNSLTQLRLGGAFGGADFNPKNKSNNEIKQFCQSFIMELSRFIGPEKDIPSGGSGVGEREIGYMYGRYKRMKRSYDGGLAGDAVINDLASDVSLNRERATGIGCVLFAKRMVEEQGRSLEGARCVLTGSGNVAISTARALIDAGAIVLTLSDTSGFVFEENGFTKDMLDQVERVKKKNPYGYNKRMSEYSKLSSTGKFFSKAISNDRAIEGNTVWTLKSDYGFPCAVTNEVEAADIKSFVIGGGSGIFEGSNRSCSQLAVENIYKSGPNFLYAPSKASNAGGAIMSALSNQRMTLTSIAEFGKSTTQEELLSHLTDGINQIYEECHAARELYSVDMNDAANIAAFSRLGHAMIKQGYI